MCVKSVASEDLDTIYACGNDVATVKAVVLETSLLLESAFPLTEGRSDKTAED